MFFASDNGAPVPPQVMAALARANTGYAMPYGNDDIMAQVRTRIRALFEAPEAAVYLVATGTAANALALASYCPPWGAVFCHRHAHIQQDECGAPEFFTGGAKLVPVEGAHGKITPQTLMQALDSTGEGGVHGVQRSVLSLTNVTEAGTVYTAAEVAALCALARDRALSCHMDGARFANALAATGATPAEMSWRAGIDVLSFGGTKNGLLGVEAVILFDAAKAWEFELRRKRAGHLASKQRYLATQMLAYLEDGLWLRLAAQANAMAARLAAAITTLPGAGLTHPAEANIVFAHWPAGGHARAQAVGAAYYPMPAEPANEAARLVCSWCTTKAEVDAFVAALAR